MGIKIIADSASDMTQKLAAELGIEVLALTVNFGEESYRDGFDLTHREFYEKLVETDVLPTTSQISPFYYEEAFEKYVSEGHEVLCITISSKLSGCYQSACIAASGFKGRVKVVDSMSVSVGERILAEQALRYIKEGLSINEVWEKTEKAKEKLRIIALLDTLEYLKKGGRISPTVAVAGNLLSIKPVVAMDDGKVGFLGSARGSKNANNKLKELIKKEGAIDFTRPLCLGYTGFSTEVLNKYIQDSAELYECEIEDIPISCIGSAVGTHIGPGAIAAAFFIR